VFESDRTFSISSEITGMPEWYFQAREGNAGPFGSKEEVLEALEEFIKTCIASGNTGGRNSKSDDGKGTNTKIGNQAVFNFGLKGKIHWY
jgi:hypothetical protein